MVNTFFLIMPVSDNVEEYGTARQVPNHNIIQHMKDVIRMPNNLAKNTHTLTFVNYFFSRATMVTQMHCHVTLNTHVQPCCKIKLPVHVY